MFLLIYNTSTSLGTSYFGGLGKLTMGGSDELTTSTAQHKPLDIVQGEYFDMTKLNQSLNKYEINN